MRLSALAGLVLVSACYHPDLTGVRYKCDAENPICPAGLSCVQGQCQAAPGDPPGGGGGDADLSAPPPGDLSAPPPGDLSAPPPGDLSADPAAGCALRDGRRNGVRIGDDVYACRGSFNRGEAARLCEAATHTVCTSAAGIDPARCDDLNGFFGSAVVACRAGAGSDFGCAAENQCGSGSMRNRPLQMGCGRFGIATGTLPGDRKCGGFRGYIDCNVTDGYNCDRDGIPSTMNLLGQNGILCCRK